MPAAQADRRRLGLKAEEKLWEMLGKGDGECWIKGMEDAVKGWRRLVKGWRMLGGRDGGCW